jgi:hypothetical protein
MNEASEIWHWVVGFPEAIRCFAEHYEKVITALTGLMVAVFTGTLWYSTLKLFKATKKAAKQSAHVVSVYERPWLFIELETKVFINEDSKPNRFHIRYTISNHGRTPALYIALMDSISLEAGFKTAPRQCPSTLPPGKEFVVVADVPSELNDRFDENRRLHSSDVRLSVWINYDDITRKTHVTKRNYHFDRILNRFSESIKGDETT